MSIASAIVNKQQQVADCYMAISNKGGTLPETQNISNMPTAINSITSVNNTTLSVTPTTSSQSLSPSSPYTGYSSVSVDAVTSSIDANIMAGNIKSGVSILGVSGSVVELNGETRTVSITSTSGNTFTPSSGKNGITSIKVNPTNKTLSITPSTSAQTKTVPLGYSGYGTVSVSKVTSSIDSNISADNIKNGVSILGVTGTYKGEGGEEPTFKANFWVDTSGNSHNIGTDINNDSLGAIGGILSLYETSISTYQAYNTSSVDKTATRSELKNLYLSSLTTISGDYSFNKGFEASPFLTSVDLSSLTTISGARGLASAFWGCTALTSVDLSSLTTISGESGLDSAFRECTALTSVDLSSLTTISGASGLASAFRECTALTSVDLSGLESITNGGSTGTYVFYDNAVIDNILLTNLSLIDSSRALYRCFASLTNLKNIYFNSLTTNSFGSYVNQFEDMLRSTLKKVTHTLHFPSNLSSKISTLTGYPTFGGSSGYVTIAFDLPATS